MEAGPLLTRKLLAGIHSLESGIPFEFLTALVNRFTEDGLQDIFGPALLGLHTACKQILSQPERALLEVEQILNVLIELLQFKPLAIMVYTYFLPC